MIELMVVIVIIGLHARRVIDEKLIPIPRPGPDGRAYMLRLASGSVTPSPTPEPPPPPPMFDAWPKFARHPGGRP